MIENTIPQKAPKKNIWQQLLGPELTEELIAEAHRDAQEIKHDLQILTDDRSTGR